MRIDLKNWNRLCDKGDEMVDFCAVWREEMNNGKGAAVLVKFGEVGFFPAPQFKTRADVESFNQSLRVTSAQAKAMETGSVLGFHVIAAKPTTWSGFIK